MVSPATRLLLFITAASASLLVGCGDPLVPVKGRITLNGQPVPRGDIWFVPDPDKGAKHSDFSISKLDANGRYELTTFTKPGVRKGWYKVVVYATATDPPASPYGWTPDWIVPAKYADGATSGLTAEVVASPDPLVLDFDLKAEP